MGRPTGTDLVQARLSVHHHGALVAQLGERVHHEIQEAGVGHADDLAARSGRIGQRPQEVHDRGDPEFAAHRDHMAHGGVEEGREHEDDPRLCKDRDHRFRGQLHHDAQRLQNVRAPALRGEGAIAVLRDPHAPGRNDQRGRCRDVEGRHPPAPGPAGVDEGIPVGRPHRDHRSAQRLDAARNFRRRQPLVCSAARSAPVRIRDALPDTMWPKAAAASRRVRSSPPTTFASSGTRSNSAVFVVLFTPFPPLRLTRPGQRVGCR